MTDKKVLIPMKPLPPAGAFKMCDIDIKVDGDEYVAIITHHQNPKKDTRHEVPPKEIRAKDKEDLLTEMTKYLVDCYDD